jgi:hypothetical protein
VSDDIELLIAMDLHDGRRWPMWDRDIGIMRAKRAGETQSSIARQHGISVERVRQITAKIGRVLRLPQRALTRGGVRAKSDQHAIIAPRRGSSNPCGNAKPVPPEHHT